MTLTPVKTPIVAKMMFPNFIWDIATTEKIIYLTFDDGPTPEITNWTLKTLNAYNAKATFFCIGKNIEQHPDIFENIIIDGHAIGNHTHNHIKGWKSKTKIYLANIFEADSIIRNQMPLISHDKQQSLSVKLFRPPYGQITPKQGKNLIDLGYKIIMWDVLSFDWEKDVTPEKCLKNVVSNTTYGSVVVFHDSVKASKNMQYTLPKVLEYFSKKGFRFEALEF